MIERDFHYCQAEKFVHIFASLIINKRKQNRLFLCKHLAIKKNMTQIKSHRKMKKFVEYLQAQRLSNRELIKIPSSHLKQAQGALPIKFHDKPKQA